MPRPRQLSEIYTLRRRARLLAAGRQASRQERPPEMPGEKSATPKAAPRARGAVPATFILIPARSARNRDAVPPLRRMVGPSAARTSFHACLPDAFCRRPATLGPRIWMLSTR